MRILLGPISTNVQCTTVEVLGVQEPQVVLIFNLTLNQLSIVSRSVADQSLS